MASRALSGEVKIILESDSSDDEDITLIKKLRKKISTWEDDNRLLRNKLAEEKMSNLKKIDSLQADVKGKSFVVVLVSIASLIYLFSLQTCR